MKRILFVFACVWIACAATAWAQKPATATGASRPQISPGDVSATPEMWFYEQQIQRHDSTKVAIRERAEFEANQREHRIAAMKWYGFSNQRPTISTDPVNSNYGPVWASNAYDASKWHVPVQQPTIIAPSAVIAPTADVRRY